MFSSKVNIPILVVDVGGTNTDIYDLSGLDSSSYSPISRFKSPTCEKDLIDLIETIITTRMHSSVLIGVPGPVNNSFSEVYCPPLGFTIYKRNFEHLRVFVDSLVIANDLASLSYILLSGSSIHCGSSSLLITVGTSMGVAKITNREHCSLVDTFESAHMQISRPPLPLSTSTVSNNLSCRACDLINAKFLIDAYHKYVNAGKESIYWESFLPLIFSSLANLSVPFQMVDTIYLYGGYIDWIYSVEKSGVLTALAANSFVSLVKVAKRVRLISRNECISIQTYHSSEVLFLNCWIL